MSTVYLFKKEIKIEDYEREHIEIITFNFTDRELKAAMELLDANPNFSKQYKNDYRGINNKSKYIGFFKKQIQIQDIEKSLLEKLIDILHPQLFTNVSIYRGKLKKYPISEIFNIYSKNS
ncbi:hypothetical protein GF361_03530 [Candidatus Woesearchaeota archaeon]|nr:hypothetical protein [Candidatus Woesearchaeota archaeon]